MSEFQQHWLSAYLDNELSTAERALVEQKLEEDSEARALLEDLKRVRNLVATLPGWGNQAFQFDMSRLNQSQTDDDDLETDKPQNVLSHMRSDSSASQSQPSSGGAMNGANRSGAQFKWRGLLALAAGLLLLVLCVPYFASRYGDGIAFSPEGGMGGGAGGGGGFGGGGVGQMNDSVSTVETQNNVAADQQLGLNFDKSPANLDSASNAPAAPMQPKLKNGFAPTPGAPFSESDAPSAAPSGGMAGLGATRDAGSATSSAMRGAPAAPDAPDAPAPAEPVPSPVPAPAPAAPKLDPLNRAETPSDRRLAEQKKDAPAADMRNSLRSMVPSNSTSAYMVAKSEAWSESEVTQLLPKLEGLLTEGSARELFIAELPKETDFNSWFAQIQTSQSVVGVQNAGSRSAGDSPASSNVELKAKQQKNAKEPVASDVFLFVTESQAKKIMASIPGRSAEQFWRVVPADEKLNKQPADEEKKVIVILKRAK